MYTSKEQQKFINDDKIPFSVLDARKIDKFIKPKNALVL